MIAGIGITLPWLEHFPHDWRVAELIDGIWKSAPRERAKEMIGRVETAIREPGLTGFTLFFHPGKGWQMSVRRRGETGWDVKIIPEADAQTILSMLGPEGHPDGPIVLTNYGGGVLHALKDVEAAQGELKEGLEEWRTK